MTTLGERVKTERRAKGWSQAELARRVTKAGYSITQGGIAQIERRGDTEPKSIVQLAQALGLSVNWLQSIRGEKTAGVTADDGEQLSMLPAGRRGRAAAAGSAPSGPRQQLQVFASAQGGSEGAMTLSNEPVSWLPRDARLEGVPDAYGCFVSGEFDGAGLRARQHPAGQSVRHRSNRATTSSSCARTRTGTRYVLIKRLVKVNAQSWTVKQYNPARTFTLSRKEWSKAHLVIGKYNRAS